ncbi:28S ribosomal protein S31, mitochondrial [Pectinophora gossypiella]|uniref:28S ribosomal protein S31, mitochondrial n=1 Tax=Pectinophora gossypiella TaxID=13191 RepID=UPI00214F4899|nr:28S ribosomal protein S31, mitochondrial [Pectinophora gossypiella]
MLTRLRFRRDFRLVARCLSDKPSDDGKPPKPENQPKTPEAQKKATDTEKIQQLLKSMLTAKPVISDDEYSKKFTVAPERKRKQKPDEIERKTEKIEESLTKAAGDVAQAIGGDVKQTEAELLSKVLGKINQTSTNLSDLIIGMKVDRSKESDDLPNATRGQQVKRLVSQSRSDPQKTRFTQRKTKPQEGFATGKRSLPQATTVNIFSGEPLGIFKATDSNYGTKLDVWESLKRRELSLATAQPPANYFQKMILWTEQGKVWKFPIDNEQGMEEEQNVHFSEHVFLDSLLEDWCPKKGPIRHFMELVCVGLSKNAFYTVKEKQDHIMWYKEYFESKKDVLTEVGAWDIKSGSESPEASTQS